MATLASFDLTLAPKPETTPATVFTANLVSGARSYGRLNREQSLLESRSSYNHFHLNKGSPLDDGGSYPPTNSACARHAG